jgi:hypothetical protein
MVVRCPPIGEKTSTMCGTGRKTAGNTLPNGHMKSLTVNQYPENYAKTAERWDETTPDSPHPPPFFFEKLLETAFEFSLRNRVSLITPDLIPEDVQLPYRDPEYLLGLVAF